MDELLNQLIMKRNELEEIIMFTKDYLSKAPDGSLRIETGRNTEQYYHRTDPKDTHGQYIRKGKKELIQQLAQKEYAEKLQYKAKVEMKKLEKYISAYQVEEINEIHKRMQPLKQKWVRPYVIPEEEFVLMWEQQTYTDKNKPLDDTGIYTERGEVVRSKSEKILADKFYMKGVPYHYEKPLLMKEYGDIYPDFTVLNRRTRKTYYWEHFGLMDNSEYVEKVIKKMESMINNGYYTGENVIFTYETQSHPLNMKIVDKLIDRYLI